MIGDISYPIYLWHWPILVLLRSAVGFEPPVKWKIGAALVSISLAWVTYRFIERPIRFPKVPRPENPKKEIFLLGGALASIALIAGVTIGMNGFPGRIDGAPSSEGDATIHSKKTNASECPLKSLSMANPYWCKNARPGTVPNYALIGDSHAQALFSGLTRNAGSTESWMVVADPGCVPFLSEGASRESSGCTRTFDLTIPAIAADPNIRWVLFAFHAHVAGKPGIDERALRTFRMLSESGKRVALLIDNPAASPNPGRCGHTRPVDRLGLRFGAECSVPRSVHEERLKDLRALGIILRNRIPSLVIFDPTDALCNSSDCPVMIDGRTLYSYTHHLSDFGVERFAAELRAALR